MLNIDLDQQLPNRLAARLARPLPGRWARSRFAPELNYGRHLGPPAHDARAAAVVVLLYRHRGRWHVPLTVRPASLPVHAGQISLPGGVVEPGESSRQAALRELDEELGIGAGAIQVLGRLSPNYIFVSNYLVAPHVAAADGRPAMRPNPDEVAEVLEVPLAAIADPAARGSHTVRRGPLAFRAPHIVWEGHRIWGVTSKILGELIAVLEEL